MDLPPVFKKIHGGGKGYKPKISLYRLKYSPRAWFNRFTKSIQSYGYTQSLANHGMFFKQTIGHKIAMLIVYVDDIILTGNNLKELGEHMGMCLYLFI